MPVEKAGIQVVGVLGAGTMGHGIAQVVATAGYQVIMRDVSDEILAQGLKRIRWSLSKLVDKKQLTQRQSDDIYDKIEATTDLDAVARGCDFLIEAVPEDFELKAKIYRNVDQLALPQTIFASNTSTLPITELAQVTQRRDRFVGTHFFHPPQLMPLVEVVRGNDTSDQTMEIAVQLIQSLGKQVVICKKDVPGFIVNRVLGPLLQEAGWLVYRGEASITEVDAAAKYGVGLPMGLFELADYSGIDVVYKAAEEVQKRDPRNVELCPLFKEFFEKGWYGQKTGKGFYEYKEQPYERPSIPREVAEKVEPVQLFAPAVNAAAWLLREGIASAADIERAVKMGLGFPDGILAMADRWGIEQIVQVLRDKQGRYGDYYRPDGLLVEMVADGKVGVKGGQGFFEYKEAEKIFEEIIVRKEPPLAWLILNRPHRHNALTHTIMRELEHALDELSEDASVRVVVLRGAGDRAFSVGADVTAFGMLTPDQAAANARKFQETVNKLDNFSKPTIAAIDGYAMGGGCEIASACDFRIATDRSQIGQPEIRLGLIPGAGGTQRVPRIVGEAKAKEMIFLGERLSAAEAERIGLVNRVVPHQQFEAEVQSFAARLAEGPPIALKLAKQAIHFARQAGVHDGLEFEAQAFGTLFSTKDLIEGVSAFLSKKKPEFKGE